jgi:hypothetical protein
MKLDRLTGQDPRPPIARRETGVLPDARCGGGSGLGVARTLPFFAPARRPEVFGPTPLPHPPPQGGWELEAEA